MLVERRGDKPGNEDLPGMLEVEEGADASRRSGAPRVERKRRKVSLIAAIVVNVVTLITMTIILLAVLLPGYRRSFTVARAVGGAQEVWIVVRTSEAMMREKSTDFIRAQDGLANAIREEIGGSGEVWAYVRDNYPDQAWIKENLPPGMRKWLEELYPKPAATRETTPGTQTENGVSEPAGEQQEDDERT
jgi:hypothetical protein